MEIRGLIDEDFVNYKKASMFIIFPYCSLKCDKDCGKNVCQNSAVLRESIIDISKEEICERYLNNPITSAIVLGGLEPFDSKTELLSFINCLRNKYNCDDDIVIYTGYTEEELRRGIRAPSWKENESYKSEWNYLTTQYKNIIIKFGRFIPGQESHYDPVLGIKLASSNQYARKVS